MLFFQRYNHQQAAECFAIFTHTFLYEATDCLYFTLPPLTLIFYHCGLQCYITMALSLCTSNISLHEILSPTVLEMACNIKNKTFSPYRKITTQEISVQNYTKKTLQLAHVSVHFICKDGKTTV